MDAVGVDGAVLISPFAIYGYDPSYVLSVYAKHPDRFGLVKPFDPRSETVADEVGEWTARPGVVGARVMLGVEDVDADDPGLDRILEAGARAGVPINLLCSGKTAVMHELARRHPNTQLVIDHVGLKQPFQPPAPPEPWTQLVGDERVCGSISPWSVRTGLGAHSHDVPSPTRQVDRTSSNRRILPSAAELRLYGMVVA